MRPLFGSALPVASDLQLAPAARAQAGNYPEQPVTIIADAAAGPPRTSMRASSPRGLSKLWSQQVVVINHPGANGSIAVRSAADAAPDGYTLFMPALSTFVRCRRSRPICR